MHPLLKLDGRFSSSSSGGGGGGGGGSSSSSSSSSSILGVFFWDIIFINSASPYLKRQTESS